MARPNRATPHSPPWRRSWANGWSAAASFEGEFSNLTRSYAGKGSFRYQW